MKEVVQLFIVLAFVSNGVFCYAQTPVEQLQRYAVIDAHALKAPKNVEKSIGILAKYLAAPAKNDREKARAIFRWVTHNIRYDIDGLLRKRVGDLSPGGVLKSRRTICSGYSALFQSLAKAEGLEVVTINGYSKGYGYSVGSGFSSTNHAWNAIKISGKWHLLDSTWGAGYINERGKFTRRFNDHYFLTRPEDFIYDHYPDKPRWQLLENPVSMKKYLDFVYLKAAFFNTGLTVKSHKNNTIKAGNNVTVTIGAPPDSLLLATLEKKGRKLDKSYVFLQRDGKYYSIHTIFPEPGTYSLRIFAKSRRDNGKYRWALDYKVVAKKGSKPPYGFPLFFAAFGENDAYLFKPLQGNLKAGSYKSFKLRFPGAEGVAIKIGNTWHDLLKNKDIYSGTVPIQKGKVQVFAKYPGTDQYSGLLLYQGY